MVARECSGGGVWAVLPSLAPLRVCEIVAEGAFAGFNLDPALAVAIDGLPAISLFVLLAVGGAGLDGE